MATLSGTGYSGWNGASRYYGAFDVYGCQVVYAARRFNEWPDKFRAGSGYNGSASGRCGTDHEFYLAENVSGNRNCCSGVNSSFCAISETAAFKSTNIIYGEKTST